MALECAHCGNRCDDGTARCPRCLRTTHLVPVAAAPAARPRGPIAAVAVAVLALAGVGIRGWVRRPAPPPPLPASAPAAASDPLAAGADLAPLVARAQAERDVVARARLVAAAVHERRAAALAGEDEPTPPPRAPALVWRVLPSPRERVTELDLARLVAAVLRAAGDAGARVAERTTAPRPDEVLDATAARGAFVVAVGDHLVEPARGSLVGRDAIRHRPLDDRSLAGAISAQAALELADLGANPARAIEYAGAAVEAWPEGPAALAARARVWLAAGASGGLASAETDLRAAVSLRDDAALHLLLARVALLRGDAAGAALAARRAAALAPDWGSAAAALVALKDVIAQLDAGAADGCARLGAARAPWTDDAYALCAANVPAEARTAAARRLLAGARDPLRVALAAAALPADPNAPISARVLPHERRELSAWLLLLGRPDLLATADAGAP